MYIHLNYKGYTWKKTEELISHHFQMIRYASNWPNTIPSTVCSPRSGASVKQPCLFSLASLASLPEPEHCQAVSQVKQLITSCFSCPSSGKKRKMATNFLHNQQTKAPKRIKTIKKKNLKSVIHLHNLVFDGTYFNLL